MRILTRQWRVRMDACTIQMAMSDCPLNHFLSNTSMTNFSVPVKVSKQLQKIRSLKLGFQRFSLLLRVRSSLFRPVALWEGYIRIFQGLRNVVILKMCHDLAD